MTRLRRIEDRDRIFFVTFNLSPKTYSLAPAERDLVLNSLQELRGPRGFLVFAYVALPRLSPPRSLRRSARATLPE